MHSRLPLYRRGRALLASTVLVTALAACMANGEKAPLPANPTPTLSTAEIARIVNSPERSQADRDNDVRRKPEQMLAFIGVRPGITVMDLSAGGGYTTELIARAVGPGGHVYGQSAPRDPQRAAPVAPEGNANPMAGAPTAPTMAAMPASGPRPPGAALVARMKNPALANMIPVTRTFEDPIPPEVASNGLDLVTLMFNYHDLGHLGVDRDRMNRAVFAALKPGGIYVIADHAGRTGTGITESGTLHRIEEDFLKREVESVGFKLAEEGYFLRNPSDPRTQNTPDPPQPKDEFVLKFVKL